MKKHSCNIRNFSKKNNNFFIVFATVIIILLFSSCQNAIFNTSDSLTALSSDNAVYATIPVTDNQEFLKGFIQKQIQGLSDNDFSLIISKLSCVYLSIPRFASETDFRFQIVADGFIPLFFEQTILTKKNGWTSTKIDNNLNQLYYKHISGIELFLNGRTQVFISDNVLVMIDNSNKMELPVSPDVASFLRPMQSQSIALYIQDAEGLISSLFQGILSIAVSEVYGRFTPFSSDKNKIVYKSSFNLQLKTPYALKPALFLLSMLAKAKNSDININQIDDTHIEISELEISPSALVDFAM